VGGFSKQYFMYYEDTDLCKKIASDGYKIRFVPEAKVVHLLGQSIRSSYERKKMYFKSQDIYFAYWQSRISQLGVKILRLPLVFLYWLRKGSI
jgi:GT2 family glycosyltransferase